MKKSKWEKVGQIFVDAGLVWIGDPCYTIAKDCSSTFESWHKFLNLIHNDPYPLIHSFNGIGICVQSGYGDGSYDVFVKTIEESGDKRVAELKVVFIEEGENYES